MLLMLKQCFEEALINPVIKKPVRRVPTRPTQDASYYYSFYSANRLTELTDTLRTLDESESLNDRFTARYLVTKEKTLLFAREGQPGMEIPAHRSIRGECLAAGNVIFSENYEFITGINHQSGDFHSTKGSMVWAIAILLFMNVPISDRFTLVLSEEVAGEFVSTPSVITKAELLALVPDAMHGIDLAANIDLGIEPETFQDERFRKKRKYESFFATPAPAAPVVLNQASGYESP